MDKDLLFKPRLPEADVDLPGVGTVRVRGLSRSEQLLAVKQGDIDAAGNVNITRVEAIERRMLVFGMVDPQLTDDEVKRWQRAAPGGELEPVTRKIQELSGMLEGADKAAYKSLRGGPEAGIRVLPGDEAGRDDGGGDASADER
jgi:hypothetical protein